MNAMFISVVSNAAVLIALVWIVGVKRKATLRFLKKYMPSAEKDLIAIENIQEGDFKIKSSNLSSGVEKTYKPSVFGFLLVSLLMGIGPILFGFFIIYELVIYSGASISLPDLLAALVTLIICLIFGWFNLNMGIVLKLNEESMYISSFWSYLLRKDFKKQIIFKQVTKIRLIPQIARAEIMNHNFKVIITTDRNLKINLFLFNPVQIKEIVSFFMHNETLKDKVVMENPSYF